MIGGRRPRRPCSKPSVPAINSAASTSPSDGSIKKISPAAQWILRLQRLSTHGRGVNQRGSEHQRFAVIQKKSAQIAGAAAARDRSQDSNRKPLLVRFGMFAEIEDFAAAVKHLLR